MRLKKKILITALAFTLGASVNNGQEIINKSTRLCIQPQPKEVTAFNKSIIISEKNFISINADNAIEQKAAAYLSYILEDKYQNNINVEVNGTEKRNSSVSVRFMQLAQQEDIRSGQYYEVKSEIDRKEIIIKYCSQTSAVYGVVTLAEYFEKQNDEIFLNLFDIIDYPDYSRRIISSNPNPENIFQLLNYALRNKIETVAIASRIYPWYEVREDFKELFVKIKEWKDKFGAPSVMQMHNIYEGEDIEISSEEDINALMGVIRYGAENGADKLMILADDTPPFEYGEGYVLTSENDKRKFKHMAEAHCYLLSEIKKWFKQNSFTSEIYYVPAFYTYEDMFYGDIELYKNTPWEEEAFKPLYRDLKYVGLNMPDDVFVIWTGPVVRSRIITENDITEWTSNLHGVTPFLWDNTIYSHNAFISAPLFSAWDNDFPDDFNMRTAGNGMFINGDAVSEDSKASVITVNDYMWNSKNYEPEKSISTALARLYGKEKTDLLLDFKNAELGLRRMIGERQLWFESDTLWKIIRKIRFIHNKNPFYYHYNYTRMKALRLQLKNSVSEPVAKDVFVKKCIRQSQKRDEILNDINKIDPKIADDLKKIIIQLPDYNSIQ